MECRSSPVFISPHIYTNATEMMELLKCGRVGIYVTYWENNSAPSLLEESVNRTSLNVSLTERLLPSVCPSVHWFWSNCSWKAVGDVQQRSKVKGEQFSHSDCRWCSSVRFHLSEVEMWYLPTGTWRMVNGTPCVIYPLFCYHPATDCDWKWITRRARGYFIPVKQNVKLSKSSSCSTNFDCVSLAASYSPAIIFNDGDTKPRQERSPISPVGQAAAPRARRRGPARRIFKAFSPQQRFPDPADEAPLCSNAVLVRISHFSSVELTKRIYISILHSPRAVWRAPPRGANEENTSHDRSDCCHIYPTVTLE